MTIPLVGIPGRLQAHQTSATRRNCSTPDLARRATGVMLRATPQPSEQKIAVNGANERFSLPQKMKKPLPEDNPHREVVDAWAARIAPDLAPRQVIDTFGDAFDRLWQRARKTLGDITLIAISDRVLYTASREFSVLDAVSIGDGGIELDKLREGASETDGAELLLAAQFVLIEFLTVLGKLVANILTPALHAELANAAEVEAAANKDLQHDESP